MTTIQTVNTELLKTWIRSRKFGVETLTINSQVCSQIIRHALKGILPEPWARRNIAEAMGVDEAVLFPSVAAEKQAA